MPAFESKPIIVNAKRYFEAEAFTDVSVPAGHWLIERDGQRNVLTDERFRDLFRPIGKEGVKEMTTEFKDGKVIEYDPNDPVVLRSSQWNYEAEDAEFEIKGFAAGVDAVMAEIGA